MLRRACRFCLLACLPSLLLFPTTASAAEFGLGLRAGTQGFGLEAAVSPIKLVAVRAGGYMYDYSDSFEEGGIDYDGDLQLESYGVLVDIFPTGGKFRLTGGLLSSQNKVEILATPTQDVEIGGTTYTPQEAGTLSGVVDFDSSAAPYVGIGYGNVARGGRVGFLFDLGLVKQGSGDVTLVSTSSAVSQADLDAEAAQIEADVEDYDIWPVISFGLAIRF